MSNAECPFFYDVCRFHTSKCFFEDQAKGINMDPDLIREARATIRKNTRLGHCPNRAVVCELLDMRVEDIRVVDPTAVLIG